MAVFDNVNKVWISDTVLEILAKRVVKGEECPNISKSDWQQAAEARAEEPYKDSGLSPQQKFTKAVGGYAKRERGSIVDAGDELTKLYYAAAKSTPRFTDYDDATSVGERSYTGSTPRRVIPQPKDHAYVDEALALERGRAAREAAAMRPDTTPRKGDEEPSQGGANIEARTRAARRHAANPSRPFERHHADVLRDDPALASRVLAEERANRAA